MATNHRGQPIGNPATSHGGASARPMGRSDLPRLSKVVKNSINEDLSRKANDMREDNPLLGYSYTGVASVDPQVDEFEASHMLRRYREDRNAGMGYDDMDEMAGQIGDAVRRRGKYNY